MYKKKYSLAIILLIAISSLGVVNAFSVDNEDYAYINVKLHEGKYNDFYAKAVAVLEDGTLVPMSAQGIGYKNGNGEFNGYIRPDTDAEFTFKSNNLVHTVNPIKKVILSFATHSKGHKGGLKWYNSFFNYESYIDQYVKYDFWNVYYYSHRDDIKLNGVVIYEG
ncbi:MAG: hypothetical protein LBT10_07665 [Methanobrevibacter sp.]|jgi:hypothetical protein|nr:hypothetical protein [Methanobrevibacter sp.]